MAVSVRDHPRGCGEKRHRAGEVNRRKGSSPRVRGKARRNRNTLRRHGIIPAGAGKRLREDFPEVWTEDHPRGCGEKAPIPFAGAVEEGSSPRVRGKAKSGGRRRRGSRIIPAGAGKSGEPGGKAVLREDHPRGCGEKSRSCRSASFGLGSSPRVRGKVLDGLDGGKDVGIIPAGAGKRHRRLHSNGDRWDHPRGCGEKFPSVASVWRLLGSSPRVRGKVPKSSRGPTPMRIIPAGAGKSCPLVFGSLKPRDHPRGCGEKFPRHRRRHRPPGSSPRVRGKVFGITGAMCSKRIIPAGAGKSCLRSRADSAGGDHPRGCGEKGICGRSRGSRRGSSPRVRGKVPHPRSFAYFLGIIPAGAGKRGRAAWGAIFAEDHPRGCGEKTKGSVGREGVEHWEEGVFIEFGVWRRGGG